MPLQQLLLRACRQRFTDRQSSICWLTAKHSCKEVRVKIISPKLWCVVLATGANSYWDISWLVSPQTAGQLSFFVDSSSSFEPRQYLRNATSLLARDSNAMLLLFWQEIVNVIAVFTIKSNDSRAFFWAAGPSCLRNYIQKCGVVLVLHRAICHAIAHLLLVNWQACR